MVSRFVRIQIVRGMQHVCIHVCMCICMHLLLFTSCEDKEKKEKDGSTEIVRARCFENSKDMRKPPHALLGTVAPRREKERNSAW